MSEIFHITTEDGWETARSAGVYRGDALQSEGFIHASTSAQVIEVANRLFNGRRDLLLLRIDADRVAAEIRVENLEGGDEQYPHIYGPLNLDAVTATVRFRSALDGTLQLPPNVVACEENEDVT